MILQDFRRRFQGQKCLGGDVNVSTVFNLKEQYPTYCTLPLKRHFKDDAPCFSSGVNEVRAKEKGHIQALSMHGGNQKWDLSRKPLKKIDPPLPTWLPAFT